MRLFQKTTVTCAILAMAAIAGNALANDTTDAIKSTLEARYPATMFTEVKPSPIHGLYEVIMGKNIAYTDAVGKFMLFGHMFDMKAQKDLTADEINSINKVDVSKLPLANAIKTVQGNGARVMYVFSDPECPYCKRLEPELAKIDNVTIYTFLFPLESLHPGTTEVSKKIWCSKRTPAAWKTFMATGSLPSDAQSDDCETPVNAISRLGEKLGINGTPTLIFSNGAMVPGALPAAEIEKRLDNSKPDNLVKIKSKAGS